MADSIPPLGYRNVTERVTLSSPLDPYNLGHAPAHTLSARSRDSGTRDGGGGRRLWRLFVTASYHPLDRLERLAHVARPGRVQVLGVHARAWSLEFPRSEGPAERAAGERDRSSDPSHREFAGVSIGATHLQEVPARGQSSASAHGRCGAKEEAGRTRVRKLHARARVLEVPGPDGSGRIEPGDGDGRRD